MKHQKTGTDVVNRVLALEAKFQKVFAKFCAKNHIDSEVAAVLMVATLGRCLAAAGDDDQAWEHDLKLTTDMLAGFKNPTTFH
jgi:hypothetical protein